MFKIKYQPSNFSEEDGTYLVEMKWKLSRKRNAKYLTLVPIVKIVIVFFTQRVKFINFCRAQMKTMLTYDDTFWYIPNAFSHGTPTLSQFSWSWNSG